ncbi:MAG: Mth938-like domain-containing protein [Rhizobiaceae bacterium]
MKGLEIKEAHFPGRAPIDAYGNGGFRFAEMSHKGSLLCLPSGIYAWNVDGASDLAPKMFDKVVAESGNIEILLLGTGMDLVPINQKLRMLFREQNISADSMSTGAAVRTFNVLLSENRAVAAALLVV